MEDTNLQNKVDKVILKAPTQLEYIIFSDFREYICNNAGKVSLIFDNKCCIYSFVKICMYDQRKMSFFQKYLSQI